MKQITESTLTNPHYKRNNTVQECEKNFSPQQKKMQQQKKQGSFGLTDID